MAHLNVFKLPQKYQELVWDGPLNVSHIRELQPMLNGGVANAIVIRWLDQILERKLTVPELREAIKPELKEKANSQIRIYPTFRRPEILCGIVEG